MPGQIDSFRRSRRRRTRTSELRHPIAGQTDRRVIYATWLSLTVRSCELWRGGCLHVVPDRRRLRDGNPWPIRDQLAQGVQLNGDVRGSFGRVEAASRHCTIRRGGGTRRRRIARVRPESTRVSPKRCGRRRTKPRRIATASESLRWSDEALRQRQVLSDVSFSVAQDRSSGPSGATAPADHHVASAARACRARRRRGEILGQRLPATCRGRPPRRRRPR